MSTIEWIALIILGAPIAIMVLGLWLSICLMLIGEIFNL
jgi:ABC-type multidrug transport system permease subunit